MNYLLKSSRRRSKYRRPVAIAGIFLALVLLLSFFFPRLFPNVAHAVAQPVWYAKDAVVSVFKTPIAYFTFKSSLQKENDRLEERIEQLEIQAQIATLLLEENLAIKGILNREESSSRSLARVLARPPQSAFGTLVIDVPAEVGDRVVAGNAVLLGTVVETLADSAIVELYSRGDVVSEVELVETQTVGEAQGSGGGNFVLEVPKEVEVSPGEQVVKTGVTNYIIGVVEEVENNETSTFKQVRFRVPLNISSLDWVEIVD